MSYQQLKTDNFMRKCVISLLALLILYSCEEPVHPDLELFNLKGKVKSFCYEILESDDIIDFYGKGFVYEFSEEGEWINAKETITRDKEGHIIKVGRFHFIWNEKGQLMQRYTQYYANEPYSSFYEYCYNKNELDSIVFYYNGIDCKMTLKKEKLYTKDKAGNWGTLKFMKTTVCGEGNDNSGDWEKECDREHIFVRRKIDYWEHTQRKNNYLEQEKRPKGSTMDLFKRSCEDDKCGFVCTRYKKQIGKGGVMRIIESTEMDYDSSLSDKIVLLFIPNKNNPNIGKAYIYFFSLDMKGVKHTPSDIDYDYEIVNDKRIRMYNGKSYHYREIRHHDEFYLTVEEYSNEILMKGFFKNKERTWRQQILDLGGRSKKQFIRQF